MDDALRPHLDLAAETWGRYGRTDPFWSVITHPDYRNLDPADPEKVEAFYASGGDQVAAFGRLLAPHRELGGREALDFGCGVGRVTLALAPHFESVTGCDVSRGHLDCARDRRERVPGNAHVDFIWMRAGSIPIPLWHDGYDFACATLVFQHLTPPLQAHYATELVRSLAPGGHAILHLLTDYAGYRFDERRALRQRSRMQMHPLSLDDARAAIGRGAGEIVGIEADPGVHGPGMVHHYLVVAK